MENKSKPKKTIPAVFFSELPNIIPNFKKRYESNDLKCKKCNESIKEKGVFSLEFDEKENPLFICQNFLCIIEDN